jgi:HB1/ASXL restriction endonuclease-like protein with HTH domain
MEMYRLEFNADPPSLPGGAEAPPKRRASRLNGESWNAAIEAVLTEAAQPLHINEIWRRVQERDFQTTAKDPLRAIASVLVRHPVAVRTQPNTYALDNGDQKQQAIPTVAGEESATDPTRGTDDQARHIEP